MAVDVYSQTPPSSPPQGVPTDPPNENFEAHLEDLSLRVTSLSSKLDAELSATKQSFETIREISARNTIIFAILGGIGSFLGAVVVIGASLRQRQEHKDYLSERQYYEDRADQEEKRRASLHDATTQLFGHQLEIKEKESSHTEEILKLQEKSIKTINEITSAVASGAQENVKNVNEMFAAIKEILNFKVQEAHDVQDRLSEFEEWQNAREAEERSELEDITTSAINLRLSRHVYANPNPDLRAQLNGFARDFDRLGKQVVIRLTGTDATSAESTKYGEVFLRRGTVAYYDNDIVKAKEVLMTAEKIFSDASESAEGDDANIACPRAFTHFYLALIEKNYGNMELAQSHIDRSWDYWGKDRERELLTPATRAEILFYKDEIEASRTCIEELLNRMENLSRRKALPPHEQIYVVRSRLLMGNTFHVLKEWEKAIEHYTIAINLASDDDYYVRYSLAQAHLALKNGKAASQERAKAFKSLVASDHLNTKRALDTRILLNALAHRCAPKKDQEVYKARVLELWEQVTPLLGGLELRLFSLEQKKQVTKDVFYKELFS